MRDFSTDHAWLSLNTATVRKQGDLLHIIEACARHEIRAISPWRDQVAAGRARSDQAAVATARLEALGLLPRRHVSRPTQSGGRRRATTTAARSTRPRRLAPPVSSSSSAACRSIRGRGSAVSHDIALARGQVEDGIGELLDYAKSAGMPLAIEPLHPMYAADRACVNTLAQALDICDRLDPSKTGALGVALDVYHVWWDPDLYAGIKRAGRARLLAFHVCDWLVPTRDLLLDRGMMGDGVIEIRKIREAVEAEGFAGFSEVEIFSELDWWTRPMDEVLATCIARHKSAV